MSGHRRGRINYTEDELDFVKTNCRMQRPEMHAEFIRRFERRDISLRDINNLCKRKGWRTGRKGPNERCMFGANRRGEYLSKDGYIDVNAFDPEIGIRRIRKKHRILWVQQHGPIPDGHVLKCLDGNKENTDPSNWTCVPNGVIAHLRDRDFDNAPVALKPTIMAVAKLKHQVRTRNRREPRK